MTKNGFFLQNGWILPTLEALEVKTAYPKKFITKLKVVYNVFSDNFYCNQNAVRSNLKKTVQNLKNYKICEFDQLWRLPEIERCKIGDIICLKYSFWQLLFQLKHSMIKSEISVSDLLNRWIFLSGKFWRLLGGERCTLEV